MTAIVTIGIDLAKNVFAVHGVGATGKPALVRPSVPRAKLFRAQGSSAQPWRDSGGRVGMERKASFCSR